MRRPFILFATGAPALCAIAVALFVFALPPAQKGTQLADRVWSVRPDHSLSGIGEYLTVRIAVLGPGDELYFWWGHIALVIDDARTGESLFFDYGQFSFGQENFFLNFALGRLYYGIGVSNTAANFAQYARDNRDVTVYTLDLPPDAREMILRQAQWDVLPGNNVYLYHHFRQNCATPIINIIDMATDGQFSERFAAEPGRFTLREQIRRHMWHSPLIDWALNFLMGQGIDEPIYAWDEMFLPSEVGRNIAGFEYLDPAGERRALVSRREDISVSSGRPQVLQSPPSHWPGPFALGMGLALLVCALSFARSRAGGFPAFARAALGTGHALFGLAFGGASLALFFLALFTDHDYTFANANMIFASPLLFALVPLGIRMAALRDEDRRMRAEIWARSLWLLVALGILASMLIKLSAGFWQDNLAQQLLMLPVALALAFEPAGLKKIADFIGSSKGQKG